MRRFFRFSVRDLLWLTLVVGLGLGWFVRERSILTKAEEAIQEKAEEASKLQSQFAAVKGALEYGGWSVEVDTPWWENGEISYEGLMAWPPLGEAHHHAVIYRRAKKPK